MSVEVLAEVTGSLFLFCCPIDKRTVKELKVVKEVEPGYFDVVDKDNGKPRTLKVIKDVDNTIRQACEKAVLLEHPNILKHHQCFIDTNSNTLYVLTVWK